MPKKPLTNPAPFHNKTSKRLGIKMNILHISKGYKKLNDKMKTPSLTTPLHQEQGNDAWSHSFYNIVLEVLVRAIMKKKE